jgi:hypothetical protein
MKTEELLNLLLWSVDTLARPTFRNLDQSFEAQTDGASGCGVLPAESQYVLISMMASKRIEIRIVLP